MNWRLKGIVQKILSVVPGGVRINDALQQVVGDLGNFEKHVEGKVSDWAILAAHISETGWRSQDWCKRDYVEIGTGWIPTLPLCFALGGGRRCITFDLFRHLNPRLTRRLVHALEPHLLTINRVSQSPIEEVYARYRNLVAASSLEELLDRANIEYRAPADATKTGLPESSIDVVFSNSVLEHIPPLVILALLKECQRILRRGGISVHSVGCNDHYRHFDRTITPIHYLQYSERQWRFWNNNLQYQNRLRPQDFLELVESAGLKLVLQKTNTRKDLLDVLPQMRIAPEFLKYPPEQLCATALDFVARKE